MRDPEAPEGGTRLANMIILHQVNYFRLKQCPAWSKSCHHLDCPFRSQGGAALSLHNLRAARLPDVRPLALPGGAHCRHRARGRHRGTAQLPCSSCSPRGHCLPTVRKYNRLFSTRVQQFLVKRKQSVGFSNSRQTDRSEGANS